MQKYFYISIICILVTISSCKKQENWGEINSEEIPFIYYDINKRKGVFIVCEGNFGYGNGSLSFYNKIDNSLVNDVFSKINNRPLGDVPQSVFLYNSKAYIVVNNSGKIEIINQNNFKSIKTIIGLNSPRYLIYVGNNQAILSDLYHDSLTYINLINDEIIGRYKCNYTIEKMISISDKIVGINWLGNKIVIFNTTTKQVEKIIQTAKEPNSIVKDKNNNIWILSSGGYMNEEYPELLVLSGQDFSEIKRYKFPHKDTDPFSLVINKELDTIYFINNNNVYKMSILDETLPSIPLISGTGKLFYKMNIDPENNDLWITDAVDYQQKGWIYIYDSSGRLKNKLKVDIIPGEITFE